MLTALTALVLASLAAPPPAQDPAPDALAPDALAHAPGAALDLRWLPADEPGGAPTRLAMATGGRLVVVDVSGPERAVVFAPDVEVRPLLSQVPGRLAALAKAGATGEVVVWDTSDWSEVARVAVPEDRAEPTHLALADGGVLVGTEPTDLLHLDFGARPDRPVAFGPIKGFHQIAARGDGLAVSLPYGSLWGEAARAEDAHGLSTTWSPAGGRNLLAADPVGDLVASYRVEPSFELRVSGLDGSPGPAIDLGRQEPQSVGLGPAGVLASLPAAALELSWPFPDTHGQLRLYDPATGLPSAHGRLLDPFAEAGTGPEVAGPAPGELDRIGLHVAAAGGEHWATIDRVDHQGEPAWWLRLRGPQLDILAEARITRTTDAPMHLVASGSVIVVVHEEVGVQTYLVEEREVAGDEAEARSFFADDVVRNLTPGPFIPISAQDDPTGATTPQPRRIFALRGDGKLLAMAGTSGAIFFADPTTGWPHRVISVRLPKEAGRPLSARFDGEELVMTCEVGTGDAAELFEFALDDQQNQWAPGIAFGGPRLVAAGREARLVRGPGHVVEVIDARAEDLGERVVDLVVLSELGFDSAAGDLDALAIGPGGELALAFGGRVHLRPALERR